MGGNEKSAKGYMAKENIAKGYIDKATTRPEGRSLRAPKWDEAKNRPKGTSARSFSTRKSFSARGYVNKGTQSGTKRKIGQRVHHISKEFFDQRDQRVYQ